MTHVIAVKTSAAEVRHGHSEIGRKIFVRISLAIVAGKGGAILVVLLAIATPKELILLATNRSAPTADVFPSAPVVVFVVPVVADFMKYNL